MSNNSIKQFSALAIPAACVAAYYSDSEYFPIIAGTIGSAILFPLMVDGASGLFIEEIAFDPDGRGDNFNGVAVRDARQKFHENIERHRNKTVSNHDSDDFDIEIEYIGPGSVQHDKVSVLSNKSNIAKSNDFFNPSTQFIKDK